MSILKTISRLKTSRMSAYFRSRLKKNRYLLHYKAAFAFSDFLFPHHHRQALRTAVQFLGTIWGFHVPHNKHEWVRLLHYTGEFHVCDAMTHRLHPVRIPFWVRACQHLWLLRSNDVYQRFTYVSHTIHP